MLDVYAADALGQKDLERLAQKLIVGVAEHPFGRRIHERDASAAVDQYDALRGRFEKSLTGSFAPSQCGVGDQSFLQETLLGALLLDGGGFQRGDACSKSLQLFEELFLRLDVVHAALSISEGQTLVKARDRMIQR
jgi:hypothetical protein